MTNEELSLSDATLIARLRGWARDIQAGSKAIWAMDQDLKEAAARIEQLVATNEALIKYRDAFAEMERIATESLRKSEARIKRLEAAAIALRDLAIQNTDSRDEWDAGIAALDAALKGTDHE